MSMTIDTAKTKVCTQCKFEKPIDGFTNNKLTPDGLASWCKDCFNAYQRKSYLENHEEQLERHRKYRETHREQGRRKGRIYNQRMKSLVLFHYSSGVPTCAHCGFCDIRALSIDHINGGGSRHQREISNTIYRWLINNDFPDGYQVLCMNCQFIKREEKNEYRASGA